jgi:hypothetical protein
MAFYLKIVVKTFLTIFSSCVIQHSRLMAFLPDKTGSLGRHSCHILFPCELTHRLMAFLVVKDIFDHLLILGEPTLQTDGAFTQRCGTVTIFYGSGSDF